MCYTKNQLGNKIKILANKNKKLTKTKRQNMSEEIININERREGENEVPDEELSLPAEVHEANWHDDVVDEAEDEIEEVTSFEPFENEQEYKSREIISREAENEINMFRRANMKKFGSRTLNIRFKNAAYERAA